MDAILERYRMKLKWIEYLIDNRNCVDSECDELVEAIRKAIAGEKPDDYPEETPKELGG